MAPSLTPEAAIRIRGLSFRWHKKADPVLELPALDIAPGERLFIEGPSGSGKSTLLSLLAGMNVPQKGELHLLGQNLEKLSGMARDHYRADHIGYIFQQFNLIPYLSMQDNVMLPCHFSARRRQEALSKSASLHEEAMRLLHHLDLNQQDLLDKAVTQLSVGQQQRVAAARALMGAPEILIADEPTSSLDNDRREAFIRLLFEECQKSGSTLIFVSHDATLEPLFDRSLQLADVNQAGGR
jgi:putative ABC transport system ATP-binding protein